MAQSDCKAFLFPKFRHHVWVFSFFVFKTAALCRRNTRPLATMDDLRAIMELQSKGLISPNSALKACSKLAGFHSSLSSAAEEKQPETESRKPRSAAAPTLPAITPQATKRRVPVPVGDVPVVAPPKTTKTQRTLGFYGARVMEKKTNGAWFEARLPDTVQDSKTLALLPCPWCEHEFKTPQALGNHKKFSHVAAYEAEKLAGTVAIDPKAATIPLDVINTVMLCVGKLESQLGKWHGARKLNEKTGSWEDYDGEKRKKQRGASHRVMHPIWLQLKAIRLCDEFKAQGFSDAQASAGEAFGISPASMSRHLKPEQRAKIEAACKTRSEARKVGCKRKVKDKFQVATDAVLKLIAAKRSQGFRVGPRWLRATYKREVRTHYDNPQSRMFKCSYSFLDKWRRKYGISIRRRTNTKRKPPEAIKPQLIAMHVGFKKRVSCEGKGKPTYHPEEGTWQVQHRFSVDQVSARGRQYTYFSFCRCL